MTDVTITQDEKIAAQVQEKAAVDGKSVSKFIADVLEREAGRWAMTKLDDGKTDLEVLEEILSGPRWPVSDNGRLPTREECFDGLQRRWTSK